MKWMIASDLHGSALYTDALLNAYEREGAERLVLLGDLFPAEFTEADKDYVIDLTQRMQEIAQVYFAMGNHEKSYTAKYGGAWMDEIKKWAGKQYADLLLEGSPHQHH